MSSPVVPNLHDATLIDIRFEWELGECVLRFAGSPFGPRGPFQLRWSEVSDFRLSRRLEWGPSVSVMGMVKSGTNAWVVEMQTGDKIEITGTLAPLIASATV
jgi:hypothetical protein